MTISKTFKDALENQYDLAELLQKSLKNSDNRIAFIEREGLKSIQYKDFYSDIEGLAGSLQRENIKPKQVVILCCDDEESLIKGFWASQLVGAISVPLTAPMSFSQDDDALKKLLSVYEQCPGAILLTDLDKTDAKRLRLNQKSIELDQIIFFEELSTASKLKRTKSQPDDIAMLMFSSGSTGDPKGVCLTHKNLLTNLWQISERSELTEEDSSLSWLPLTHDMGLVLFHMCHTLVGLNQFKMTPLTFVRDPNGFLEWVSQEKISLIGMPNFGFDTILRDVAQPNSNQLNLGCIRAIYNGAEPIDPKLIRRFYNHFSTVGLKPSVISPGYGIAECCVVATQHPHRELAKLNALPSIWLQDTNTVPVGEPVTLAQPGDTHATELVSLGPVMDGMALRIVDDAGNELDPLCIGHIQFSGDNVTQGYWGKDTSLWCQTGDLGFVWNNHVFISGRAKDVLFINGKNYFSNDLESRLCHRLGWQTNQLAVVGYREAGADKEQVALFYRKDRHTSDFAPHQLRSELESLLSYPVETVVGLSALPKTTSGKIRRFQLRQGLIDGSYDQDIVQLNSEETKPLTEKESWVWKQTCAVNGIKTENPNASVPLSHYGLDSIRWTQLCHRLNSKLGISLQLNNLIEVQSIQGIVSILPEELVETNEALSDIHYDKVLLSDSQYMLWSSYLLEDDKSIYNENYSLHFNANLDVNKFEKIVNKVVTQHRILNVVVDDKSTPMLVPNRDKSIDYKFIDYSNNFDALEEQLVYLSNKHFDLRKDSPIRIRLYKTSLNDYCLFISAHHLVIDGWSFSILIQDLFDAYQHPNQAIVETGLLQSNPVELDQDNKEYWKALLSEIEPLELPQQSKQSGINPVSIIKWNLDPRVHQFLHTINKNNNASTYSIIASAVSLLFSKLSDSSKPVLGTLVANRHSPHELNRIGYYAQTLPLAPSITPEKSALDIAKDITDQTLRIISQPALSLEQISDISGKAIATMLDVVYVHQNTPSINTGDNIQVVSRKAYRSQPRTGIYITSEYIDDNLELTWEFDNNRFSQSQVEYYIELFNQVLSQISKKPELTISNLDWQTGRHTAINQLMNRIDPDIDLELNVIQRFRSACNQFKRNLAVSDDHCEISYGELKNKVDSLSTQLVDSGVEKGDRICLLTDRSVNYVIAQLATLQVGGLFVPIDPTLPDDRIKFIVEDCKAKLLLTTEAANLNHSISSSYNLLCFNRNSLPLVKDFKPASLTGSDGAYLIYTSGTTGRPKGVVNDHKSLSNLIEWISKDFAYEVGETFCQFAPFSFDVSIAEILPSVCTGLHVYILSTERRASPQEYLTTLKEKEVNIATVTPAFFYLFMDDPDLVKECMKTMRIFILGGEALNTQEVNRFQKGNPDVQLVNVYGPTETTVLSTFYYLPNHLDMDKQWQPLGLPVANTEIVVLTNSLEPALLTQTGEIYIGGSGLSQGYWNDPKKTQAAFKKLKLGSEQERLFYKTGDLARLTTDGQLEFVGRSDNQIKIRGFRIELGEIEKALDKTDEVTQSILIPVKNPNGQMALAAYYCGERRDKNYFNHLLSQSLPKYMLPDYYCHLETMPLTHNGKADRKKLPSIDFNSLDQTQYVAPDTDTEIQLVTLWKELLKLETISRTDSFFDIGGNSLTAAKLVYSIKQEFSASLSISDIFTKPILKELAEVIEASSSEENETHPGIVRTNQRSYPVSDTQASMVFTELNSPSPGLNNMPLSLELESAIAVVEIHDALRALAKHHEILSCYFDITEQGITQNYSGNTLVEFSVENDVPYSDFINHAKDFHCQSFNLNKGPLWRAMVLNSTEGYQWLNLSFHHTIADGVTLDLFVADLNKALLNQPLKDSQSSPNYGDFCLWLLQDKINHSHHEEFWNNQLINAKDCNLPLKASHSNSMEGEQFLLQLPESLSVQFIKYCGDQNISPFNFFMSVYSFVLSQETEQNEVTVGLTLSGRENSEQENIAGLFVNTLPLTIKVNEEHNFNHHALDIQKSILALMDHQSYPLINVQRLAKTHKPLFNVLFNQEVVRDEMVLQGKPAKLMGVGTNSAKFPLLISLMVGNNIGWRVEYQVQQLDRQWINELQDSVIKTIERLLEMPELPMSALSHVDDELMALLETE